MPATNTERKNFLNDVSAKTKINTIFDRFKNNHPHMAVYFYNTDRMFVTFNDTSAFNEGDLKIGRKSYNYASKFVSAQDFNTQHTTIVAGL